MSPDLQRLRDLIADDAWALTFQSFGQYRTALLAEIRRMAAEIPQEATTSPTRAGAP